MHFVYEFGHHIVLVTFIKKTINAVLIQSENPKYFALAFLYLTSEIAKFGGKKRWHSNDDKIDELNEDG